MHSTGSNRLKIAKNWKPQTLHWAKDKYIDRWPPLVRMDRRRQGFRRKADKQQGDWKAKQGRRRKWGVAAKEMTQLIKQNPPSDDINDEMKQIWLQKIQFRASIPRAKYGFVPSTLIWGDWKVDLGFPAVRKERSDGTASSFSLYPVD